MQSILEEFFYGNISPEVHFIEKGSEYDEVMRVICCNEEKLLERLNAEEKEILHKYNRCTDGAQFIDRSKKPNLRL